MIKRQDLTESRVITQMEYEGYLDTLNLDFSNLIDSPDQIGTATNDYMRVLGCAVDLKLKKDKIIDLLTLVKEFGKANFMSIVKSKNTKEITFQNKKHPFKYSNKINYADPSSWCNSFFTSIILRDKETAKFFSSIPAEIHFSGNVSMNNLYHIEVEIIKNFYNSGKFNDALFSASFNEIDKSSLDNYDYNNITKCLKPFLTLLKNVSDNDEEAFNQNLEKALIAHQKFWTAKTNDRFYDSKGWVSLPILAVASLGKDKGFKIQIESEYTPMWLIDKIF